MANTPLAAPWTACLGMVLSTATAFAQCSPQLIPQGVIPAPANGMVETAAEWDPDGPGPRRPLIVLGGIFTMPEVDAQNIVAFDRDAGRWERLGDGPSGIIYALCTLPNGDLVAGGRFDTAGGRPVANMARWDGSQWHPFGSGLLEGTSVTRATVFGLQASTPGDIYACGLFTTAGGVPVTNLARWDGMQWHAVGAGRNTAPYSMALHPNGDLWTHSPGLPGSIHRFDGQNWHFMLTSYSLGREQIAIAANGDVLITGNHQTPAGATNNIVRWNGTDWAPLAPGTDWRVGQIEAMPDGSIVAAGSYTAPGTSCQRWDGSQWTPLARGPGLESSDLLVLQDGKLLAVGSHNMATRSGFAKIYDGQKWQGFANGFNRQVLSMAVLGEENIVAGGEFTQIGADWRRHIAIIDDNGTVEIPGQGGHATAMKVLRDGRLLAASTSGGLGVWGGSVISRFGGVLPSVFVQTIAEMPDGSIVVGLPNSIPPQTLFRSQGDNWVAIGGVQPNGTVRASCVLPNGDLLVGGDFTAIGGQPFNFLARWNGSQWSAFHGGCNGSVYSLTLLANGQLVVGGRFRMAGNVPAERIALHDGTQWRALGGGVAHNSRDAEVLTVVQLPDGDLVVGGEFTQAGVVAAQSLARWDGSSWHPVANVEGIVRALACTASGTLAIGGAFTAVDGQPSANFARLIATCPAEVATLPSGCAVAPQGPAINAIGRGWLGGSLRARVELHNPMAFGVELWGFAANQLPLAQLDPRAPAGCTLWTSGEVVTTLGPTQGGWEVHAALPRMPAILGGQLHFQVVRAEFDTAGSLLPLSASNALRFTLGALR